MLVRREKYSLVPYRCLSKENLPTHENPEKKFFKNQWNLYLSSEALSMNQKKQFSKKPWPSTS